MTYDDEVQTIAVPEAQAQVYQRVEGSMTAKDLEEVRYVSAMISLLILAMIGAGSGGVGGALTNGLDGFMVGGCAGFILGVVAWITDSMAEQRKQELHTDQLPREFDQTATPVYDQVTSHQPPNERLRLD